MFLFHTDNLPHYGLDRIFEFAKEAGFDGLEVGVKTVYDTQNPAYLKELEKRHKIKIKAFSLSERNEEKLMEAFQHTVREFPGTTINVNPSQVLSFGYKKWLENTVPKLARKYQLKLCRKNVPPQTMLGMIPKRTDNSLEALKARGNVCLDITALALSNENIIQSLNKLGPKIQHIYLSSVFRNQPYSLPHQGVLPVESFLAKLAQKEYKGDFTLRVDRRFLSEGNDETVLERLKATRDFYEKYFVAEGKGA